MSHTEIDSAKKKYSYSVELQEDIVEDFLKLPRDNSSLNFLRVKERLRSFDLSWHKCYIDTLELAKAGFFFFAKPDRVQCFSCHLILGDWCITDNPWFEHAFWNSKCQHVKDKKGEEYISEVNRNWQQHCRQ